MPSDVRAYDGPPRVAHYSTDGRETGFVLDQTGPIARVQFDGEQEILAGWWRPAAGGDRILVRDDGVLILQQNVAGGVTVFTSRFPMGAPVNYDRPAMPLEGPPPPIETVRDSAREASARASQSFGVVIRFDGDWEAAADDAGVRAVLFDTVQNAGAALQQIAANGSSRSAVVKNLRGVRFMQGSRPGVSRQRSVALVIYTLDQRVSARPSSHRIAREIKLQFR